MSKVGKKIIDLEFKKGSLSWSFRILRSVLHIVNLYLFKDLYP